MQNNNIKCVGDFMKAVKYLYPSNENAFFRGQQSNAYDVSSSFCRFLRRYKEKHLNLADNFGYRLANELFLGFKSNYPAFSEVNLLKEYDLNDIDIMLVSQHYGLPTRLIDWTKNPLVALYFATEQPKDSHDCSVIMMYNTKISPLSASSSNSFLLSLKDEQKRLADVGAFLDDFVWDENQKIDFLLINKIHKIAQQFTHETFLPQPIKIHPDFLASHIAMGLARNLDSIKDKKQMLSLKSKLDECAVNTLANIGSVKINNPAKYVIEPLPINTRIKNQQGVLLFSSDINESVFATNDFLESNIVKIVDEDVLSKKDRNKGVVRIDIPHEYIRDIHDELNSYGITKDFIYPELPSFTETMARRAADRLAKESVLVSPNNSITS